MYVYTYIYIDRQIDIVSLQMGLKFSETGQRERERWTVMSLNKLTKRDLTDSQQEDTQREREREKGQCMYSIVQYSIVQECNVCTYV